MKTFSILHILLLILCMLAYKCASAQDYLITYTGDTLYGELRFLFYDPVKKVMIKSDKGKEIVSILHTKEYRYKDEIFRPQQGPSGPTFMKLVTSGYLSRYVYSSSNNTNYDGEFLVKIDGSHLDVPNLGFKKHMAEFLEDCEVVSLKINNGELGKRDLTEIITEYNNCIAKKDKLSESSALATASTIGVTASSTSPWVMLEKKVGSLENFESKSTALEMIADARLRISRKEKVPQYLIDGLKQTLSTQPEVQELLQQAIKEIN